MALAASIHQLKRRIHAKGPAIGVSHDVLCFPQQSAYNQYARAKSWIWKGMNKGNVQSVLKFGVNPLHAAHASNVAVLYVRSIQPPKNRNHTSQWKHTQKIHQNYKVITAGRNNGSFIEILVWLMLASVSRWTTDIASGCGLQMPTPSTGSHFVPWLRLKARSSVQCSQPIMASRWPVFSEFNMSICDSLVILYVNIAYICLYSNKIFHRIPLHSYLEPSQTPP